VHLIIPLLEPLLFVRILELFHVALCSA
jgi:hypothetical protein